MTNTIQSKTTLKGYFETGDTPTQSQFDDLITTTVVEGGDPTDIDFPLTGSTQFGRDATVTGKDGCLAIGGYGGGVSAVLATGSYGCFAFGFEATATGQYGSFVMGGAYGLPAIASGGGGCFAMGTSCTASGSTGCFAHGSRATASGLYGSFAMGIDVTSSDNSAFAQGQGSSASGKGSFACGIGTEASAYTAWASGHQCVADKEGQFARANGYFVSNGDAQTSRFVMRRSVTHSDANWYGLGLDGNNPSTTASARLTIAIDTVYCGTAHIVGTTSGCTKSFGFKIDFVAENDGGTTSILASTVTTVYDTDDTDFDARVSADDTNDQVLFEVQDSTSGGDTVQWVANVTLAQVTYA